ncbi:hypothetical protein FGIG_12481 [Fasciola gigantica]|uniref:Uncharacterized protein n=1 Tax=Fasciola gigantica TaxID=46835 RepID=A0A504YA42_FASGI|nr:hypothetical protein FGIG_12481 [Fasciola gigantica]
MQALHHGGVQIMSVNYPIHSSLASLSLRLSRAKRA